jgi:hypothetical protein
MIGTKKIGPRVRADSVMASVPLVLRGEKIRSDIRR